MNKVKNYNDADLKDRLVAINRVTKVTKGGRTFTFAARALSATVLVRPVKLPQLSPRV